MKKVGAKYRDFRMNPIVRFFTYPAGAIKKGFERRAYIKSEDSAEIRKYKNIHEGERCFIIGNGPSLTEADLNLIKDEYTFASNKIFNIFDRTEWRPTYYFCYDFSVISNNFTEVDGIRCKKKFIDVWAKGRERRAENSIYICANPYYAMNVFNYRSSYIEEDVSKYFSNGGTVTFTMIQAAIYMGFKEIYLLGVDFSMPYYRDKWGRVHSTDEAHAHFAGGDTYQITCLNLYSNLYAYEQAKKYCDEHNIIIKNATRGGKLEVFERIALEEILKEEKN